GAMRAVDKPGKTLRLAETGRRGVESRRLIAPGRVERMLGDRQELDMGEAHVRDIRDQAVRQFVPGKEPAVLVALPRAGMDLVDGDGLAARIGRAPEVPVR